MYSHGTNNILWRTESNSSAKPSESHVWILARHNCSLETQEPMPRHNQSWCNEIPLATVPANWRQRFSIESNGVACKLKNKAKMSSTLYSVRQGVMTSHQYVTIWEWECVAVCAEKQRNITLKIYKIINELVKCAALFQFFLNLMSVSLLVVCV